ncbi:mitochondrial S-adenosylmethionine carrier protein-like isoform X2 [Tubulanus polymorphus]|uniref:mitochondrial S-adenosylmethionine carrier protein-like isoform X2 n=1 Tax=Tubulanus polymorphus TaxID=672921 RepID=UPI003DA64B78
MAESMAENKSFIPALLAGGAAGIAVDFVLYPLDTIKTRLQSEQGLWKSGGLHGLYRGLTSVAVGSAPSAAMFFMTYEMSKNTLTPHVPQQFQPFVHMFAAGFGETAACIVRVPCEVCKQRAQASKSSPLTFFTKALQTEGISGLYRGYLSTVLREIPFAFLQFPMWEFLKSSWSKKQGHTVEPWQSSLCGAIAGAFAASSTTPLDVAKTRIMLAESIRGERYFIHIKSCTERIRI